MKPVIPILAFATMYFIGCGTDSENKIATVSDTTPVKTAVKVDSIERDSVELKETFNQEDVPVNEYLTERLKPIRDNFKRINSITNWTIVKTKDLREKTESGEVKFYYSDGQLEKITARHIRGNFQQLTEYYLLNGQLSFVFDKSYQYRRPMRYDATDVHKNGDIDGANFEESEMVEERSYFENGKLLHQLNDQDCGSPFADDYLSEEQKRIKTDFEKLIILERTK